MKVTGFDDAGNPQVEVTAQYYAADIAAREVIVGVVEFVDTALTAFELATGVGAAFLGVVEALNAARILGVTAGGGISCWYERLEGEGEAMGRYIQQARGGGRALYGFCKICATVWWNAKGWIPAKHVPRRDKEAGAAAWKSRVQTGRLRSDSNKVRLNGKSECGMEIEMWYDKSTNRLGTAYPPEIPRLGR